MKKGGVKKRLCLFPRIIAMLCFCSWIELLEGACVPHKGCSTALAYYTVNSGDNLNALVARFQTTISEVQVYNTISNPDVIQDGRNFLFPFPCECMDDLLGHRYTYTVQLDDTFENIANLLFEGLTTVDWITRASGMAPNTVIYQGVPLQVPVNCSCGNSAVSPNCGLFATYPAVSTDNITSLATRFQINEDILQQYNPSTNLSGSLSNGEILFIPVREAMTGLYPPYNFSNDGTSSTNNALIVGVSVGGGVALLLFILVLCLCYITFWRKRRARKRTNDMEVVRSGPGFSGGRTAGMLKFSSDGTVGSSAGSGHGPSTLSDFSVDKSVQFSFEELAAATNNFNVANKIGQGGYGAVYLANLRGQKLAVKRMNLQATREFLAELQVLTHVHHTNLVQLIGYCTVDSLFLIYEFVENGTLDRHLHGSHDLPPLSWPARVQIALDTARGLEYIHEHTKPTYIHRDVKSSNILIDKQLRAKVADFGLTNLTESGIGDFSLTLPTRLVGTFGYMSPEYARFGDVSPKVDVYSFGIVLFEIISAKEAIVRTTSGSSTDQAGPHKEEQRGLVTLFEEVLKHSNGKEELRRLVDPALHGNYPLESAWKMAQLAGACTQESPELRPSMRTAVVALMTLSSTTEDWETSSFGSDRVMTSLLSGR